MASTRKPLAGTTGAPKAAVLTHTALVTQSMAKLAALGYNDREVSTPFLGLAIAVNPICRRIYVDSQPDPDIFAFFDVSCFAF